MRYNTLGRTDLKVSELCLGSMTWGTQNSTSDGHQQIDMALDHGVNFIDTAEMYPTNPVKAENCGETENVIGKWFAANGRRDDVILATKIAGEGQPWLRDGAPITAVTVRDAIDASLARLQTDYIDLYQLHWPNRGSYMFRKNWTFDASGQDKTGTLTNMLEVLEEMQRQVDAGRVRHFGLSNESAWGTANWLRIAEENGFPRVQSLQNEYSLLCRYFDLDLAELSHHEDVGLLSFSPLAAGLLTGKYSPELTPQGSRRSFSPDLGGRISERVWAAIDAYLAVAKRHDVDPVQMALAWCNTRPFMASTIFGATSLGQLENSLKSVDLTLSQDVLDEIATVYKAHPMPY